MELLKTNTIPNRFATIRDNKVKSVMARKFRHVLDLEDGDIDEAILMDKVIFHGITSIVLSNTVRLIITMLIIPLKPLNNVSKIHDMYNYLSMLRGGRQS